MLESSLYITFAIVGIEWENVECIKTLVCAFMTWQGWHSPTPTCIHNEEYEEVMIWIFF